MRMRAVLRGLIQILFGVSVGLGLLIIAYHVAYWMEKPEKREVVEVCHPIPRGVRCYYNW